MNVVILWAFVLQLHRRLDVSWSTIWCDFVHQRCKCKLHWLLYDSWSDLMLALTSIPISAVYISIPVEVSFAPSSFFPVLILIPQTLYTNFHWNLEVMEHPVFEFRIPLLPVAVTVWRTLFLSIFDLHFYSKFQNLCECVHIASHGQKKKEDEAKV